MPLKKLYMITFGCQMNVYDSERIAHLLSSHGYRVMDNPEEADLIFLNTCSVREKPVEKLYSTLGRLRRLKRKKPDLIIGVGGCTAQHEKEKILNRAPHVNFIIGTKEISKIPDILDEVVKNPGSIVATDLEGRTDPYSKLPMFNRSPGVCGFVSIMQGCDNFCSFCIVPHVRGREVSRPSGKILEEIKERAKQGLREVTLLGQNVNSYGQKTPGEMNFVRLLEAVGTILGIARIRFTTSHPKDLSQELIEAFGFLPKLCEHIHLPLQSGSDRILSRMNRGYTRKDYLRKVAMLRSVCPEISITTDIIVGFPGEGEEDFRQTLETIEEVQFDDLFSFRYSDRPLTQAASFPDKIPPEISQRRLMQLQARQRVITEKKNRSWEGRVEEILVEGRSRRSPDDYTGRTRTNRIVNFSGRNLPEGSLVRVKLNKALAHSFRGELCL